MLVGLLAKLVALVLLVLAAVGVFVGGQEFVSLLDKSAGPAPPVAVRTVTTPPPSVVPTPTPDIRTPRRGGGDIATIREPGGPPGTASPQPRPARGALRPVAASRTPPPAPVTPPRQGAHGAPDPGHRSRDAAPEDDARPDASSNTRTNPRSDSNQHHPRAPAQRCTASLNRPGNPARQSPDRCRGGADRSAARAPGQPHGRGVS